MLANLRKFVQGAEGAMMVLTALGLLAFLGLGSLAIDLGHLYVVRNELQNTADAAALAGAGNLIQDQGGIAIRNDTAAKQAIMAVAQRQSQLLNLPSVPDEGRNDLTVTFGIWNIYTGNPETAWTDLGTTVGPYSNANGVRVTLRRGENLAFGPVANLIAGIFGAPSSEIMATATAFLGYSSGAEVGSVSLPFAIPDTVMTACRPESPNSWWAALLGPREAVATTTRTITFRDLGSDAFYQNNVLKPLYDTQKAYLFVVNTSDSVPSTIIDNIEKHYLTSGVKPVRGMARGTRLYPISEYRWASNIKSIFNAFKQAYNAKKDTSGKWRVFVPVYSPTNPLASRLDRFKRWAGWFSLGPTPAHACFTFWTQTYPGGNVPIYVDGFVNVDVTNVTYTSTCSDCSNYTNLGYTSQAECMVNYAQSCRNTNSVTIQIPLDSSTVSPPGTYSGGPDNQHLIPGGAPNQGALAAIPRLVK